MKLVRFDAGSGPQSGVVVDDASGSPGVVGLAAAGCACTDIMDIINGGAAALEAVARTVAKSKPQYALKDVRLLAPITRPGKYLAIGMNYKKHADEARRLGMAIPQHQVWFNKQTSCISGPFDEIDPGVSEKLDYEAELGLVIGTRAKGVSKEDALKYVFGYFVANDVSARDWQQHTPTFTMGKSFDTHGPIGPWIITADEIADPQNLEMRCYVNDELRQETNTSDMVHCIASQINYLTTAFTLEPGDLIATGTPSGVGIAMNPPVFLEPGDVVRCEIDGVGVIENRVGA
ncbi:MAG: fumarylacetoacetate hydrolase family protein [Gammaproteobacteria bacterium]|nr:fumarylacetoacetate hydrolase family protein [Gammaproteobacteria bacterium]MDH5172449.1 fumarylacetoacetate hydrolase family protein [Gammaproteobacteria bacterium]